MLSMPDDTALPSPLTSPDRNNTMNIISTTMISTSRYFFQLCLSSLMPSLMIYLTVRRFFLPRLPHPAAVSHLAFL